MKLLISIALIASAYSQAQRADCNLAGLNACKSAGLQYETIACKPLLAVNATTYNQCLCYRYVRQQDCYPFCPGDPNVVAESQSWKGSTISTCAGVGLNPDSLPKPAPWENAAIAPPPSPTGTVSGTAASSTTTAPPKLSVSSGAKLVGTAIGFIVYLLI